MECLSGVRKGWGGIGKGGATPATGKRATTSTKGKFKLSASRDPLPLSRASRETKPKAKFVSSAAGGVKSTDSPTGKALATNSFLRPSKTQTAAAPSKMRAGFSFKTFSSKAKEVKKATGDSVQKKAPLAFATTQPFKVKFSVDGLAKKSSGAASKNGAAREKETIFKPKPKGLPPLAFRDSGNPPAAKKRKTTGLSLQNWAGGLSSKKVHVEDCVANVSSVLTNPPRKRESDTKKQDQKPQKGGLLVRLNESLLKKRGLSMDQTTKGGPAPKKSKDSTQHALTWNCGNGVKPASEPSESRAEPSSANSEVDAPVMTISGCGHTSTTQEGTGFRNDCSLSDNQVIDEDYQVVCSLDDDKEQEFQARVVTIQGFTDKVAIERKQMHNRLLDAHADISESLLDAFTGLLAEEGGIGIDKLDVDMSIDIEGGELATVLKNCVIQTDLP